MTLPACSRVSPNSLGKISITFMKRIARQNSSKISKNSGNSCDLFEELWNFLDALRNTAVTLDAEARLREISAGLGG